MDDKMYARCLACKDAIFTFMQTCPKGGYCYATK